MALAVALGGCGGSSDAEVAAQQLAQARTYAVGVSGITRRTSERLAGISTGADYRNASSAASSTREYAAVIGAAAAALGRATPPERVVAQHRALVALYRETAAQMDALAAGFAQAQGERALTAKAQELSAEVQRLSTQELRLRTAIEQALPAAVTPSPTAPALAPSSSPGIAGDPNDPGDPG